MHSESNEHTVLVVYASEAGVAESMAGFIADLLQESGLHVRVAGVDDDPDPALFDAVVVGTAMVEGQPLPKAVAYAARHRPALRARPVWLFGIGADPVDMASDLGAVEHRAFAPVAAAPQGALERMVARIIGPRATDHREWQTITHWALAIASRLRESLPPSRFPLPAAGDADHPR